MDWQLQTAKNRLSALIDAVEEGEEQVITRHGKPVAVVVPYQVWRRRAGEAKTLYEALRVPEDLRGDDLAELINSARRNEVPSRPVDLA